MIDKLSKAIEEATAAGSELLKKSQMALDFGNPDAHHVAYTRTNQRGTVSHVQAKGSPTLKPVDHTDLDRKRVHDQAAHEANRKASYYEYESAGRESATAEKGRAARVEAEGHRAASAAIKIQPHATGLKIRTASDLRYPHAKKEGVIKRVIENSGIGGEGIPGYEVKLDNGDTEIFGHGDISHVEEDIAYDPQPGDDEPLVEQNKSLLTEHDLQDIAWDVKNAKEHRTIAEMIEEADREGKTADDFEHRQNDPVAAAYKREYASQMREAAANKYPRPMYFLPSREEVENLKPGDMAPDAFGNMAEVDHIYHRGEDINGKLFVGYYTKHGAAGGTMSNSMKEDELMRTVATSQKHTSRELDNIEQEMQAARKPKLPAEHQALVAKLVEQTMKAATDIGNKPEMAEYKFYIDRKVEALKANPTTKAAHNVLTDVTKMVETAAKGLKASQVEVETREHFNSHATAPKGRGSWMFSAHKNIDWDKHKHGEDYINTPSLPYKEARAFAKKWAAEKGHKVIHVMP